MSHSRESYLASTAKSGLKREMGDACNFQKHESLERSSLSSSSSADVRITLNHLYNCGELEILLHY